MKNGWKWRVVFTILFLASTPTWAQLTGTATTTLFSGHSGATHSISRSAASNDAIYSLTFGEESDDPCYLEAEYRDMGTGLFAGSSFFKQCSDADGDGNSASRLTVTLNPGTVATGIRICLNGNKMKGLELIGRYGGCLMGEDNIFLAPAECTDPIRFSWIFSVEYRLCGGTGTGTEVDCASASARRHDYEERDNCPGLKLGPDADWEKEVLCPAGKVVTGLQLSTSPGGGSRKMIDGIALECTTLGI